MNLSPESADASVAFARNVVNLRYEDIPAEAVEHTKTDVLDALGVAIAASTTVPVCKHLVEMAKETGGKPESTIIAYGGKVPGDMAAFVNAALAHGLNYGDASETKSTHAGCVVLAAALAAAERAGKVSGKEFITAYTLGLDVMCRIGGAVNSGKWMARGRFLQQMVGYFGAAAVAGRLSGLNEDQMVSAFGLAYAQTAGSTEILTGAGSDKGLYPAFAAKAGVFSVLMAQRGIRAPGTSLEGKAGLFNLYFQGEYDSTSLTNDLGKRFESVNLGFYAYPCCLHTHPFVEMTLRLADEHRIQPEDVEAITAFVGPLAQMTCEPLRIRQNPRTITEAQYSIPYAIATALAKGKPCIKHFTGDGIKDPEILRLANKVTWQPDPECDLDSNTGLIPARMEITLANGKVLHGETGGFRYGNPHNPISKEKLVKKFRDCLAYAVKPLTGGYSGRGH
jgi:2-methylcitrate dehydratase PrpD